MPLLLHTGMHGISLDDDQINRTQRDFYSVRAVESIRLPNLFESIWIDYSQLYKERC